MPIAVALAQDDNKDQTAQEGEPPAGDYTVAITKLDIPSDLVNGPDLIGRWEILFGADGSYVLRRADLGDMVTGSYTIEDQTITITDEGGLLSCANALPTDEATLKAASALIKGSLVAWDPVNQKAVWTVNHPYFWNAGVLSSSAFVRTSE